MASSSKSEPQPVDHREEEAAKKLEKKQFPSQMRYIAFLVLAIIVVMSVAMGTIWAVVRPKRPHVVVKNGYITISNNSTTTLSGTLNFEISFKNPNNKATIYFDSLNGSASFSASRGLDLSLGHAFNLTPQAEYPVYFNHPADFWSIYGYMDKYLNQGRLQIGILFKATIRFGFAKWKSLPRTINIDCSPLVVFESNGDYHTFKPSVCEVDY